MSFSDSIGVIGAPWDLGLHIRGAARGPIQLRDSNLLYEKLADTNLSLHDCGDINSTGTDILTSIANGCTELRDKVLETLDQGYRPLVIGGDHSCAIGSVSGVASFFGQRNQRIGLIWIDAHADINTPETSLSGNIHGMPLAVLLGEGFADLTAVCPEALRVRPENTAIIGGRAIDPKEYETIDRLGVKLFSMDDIKTQGIEEVTKKAISAASEGTQGVHVSFDLDALDPYYAPGVSTPEPDGLSITDAQACLEKLAHETSITSMDVVELNPLKDTNNQTAELIAKLVRAAFDSGHSDVSTTPDRSAS